MITYDELMEFSDNYKEEWEKGNLNGFMDELVELFTEYCIEYNIESDTAECDCVMCDLADNMEIPNKYFEQFYNTMVQNIV